MNRFFSLVLLGLLPTSTLMLAFNIHPPESSYVWSETIYIRADGSIDPPTAPIQRNGNTYTLIEDLSTDAYIGIYIARSNIIFDGAKHALSGSAPTVNGSVVSTNGIRLCYRNNVTIVNTNICGFYTGLHVDSSSCVTFSLSNITGPGWGIDLWWSHYNDISLNNITSNSGILLYSSQHNSISFNNLTNSHAGIYCESDSSYNYFLGNRWLQYTCLYWSSFNTMRSNILTGTRAGIAVIGDTVMQFIHDIDESNTVNGKPIYYWVNRQDIVAPSYFSNAGYVGLVNCKNVTVRDQSTFNCHWMLAFTEDSTLIRNTITSGGLGMWNCSNNVISHNDIMHSISGLCLQYSRQNAVCGNNFTNCEYALLIDLSANNSIFENNIVASNDSGIRLLQSSNNSIVGNNIANNRYGIHLVESSSNEFYHNNFINNTYQVYSYDSLNVWDDGYPSGGNYWSDYTERYPDAEEIGDSGLWDTPYVIDENNQDNYPLINPWTPPPNLPPVALFDYYPVEPKAGEQVMFNATSSYDPDGEILFYAWDWNGDGYFDEYTISPIVIFWWEEEGSYNVTLVTVDDDGATSEDSIKKEIVISESYESKIILAGWGCNPIWTALHWKDHCNFKEIDDWLRESSDRLSWLPSKFSKLEEPDIVDVLNTEIDHDLAPDVTYMDYAISMIYEAELVDEAWRQPTAKLNIMMAPLVEYVFNSIWDLFVSEQQIVELATKVSLTAGLTLAIGLPTMQMAKKIFDLKTLVDLALKEGYTLGLGRYFYNRWLYGNHEDAWNDPDVQNAVCLSISYDATEEQKNQILQETSWYFDSLWMEYYADDFYDPFVVHATGLPQDLENLIKADLKNLIISALEDNPEVLKDSIITNIASPVELYISDSQGRITGVVRGEVREEIPFSVYDWETETIRIFNTSDLYDYRTVGVSASTYKLEVTSIENGTILSFIANEIPTWLAATHQYTVDWTALFHGQEGVSVKVDSEGDGSFEYNFTSDNELTRIEYVAATTGHDLDVTRVASPKSVVGEGYTIPVNVTIMNYGVYTETFNITLYANITLVASQIVAVANASSITITFMWNTNGFAKGNYTLSAIAEQVPGETYTADNTLVDGSIRVTISGDVDGDFDVDIFDVVKITSIYASKQGDPRFSPNSDIDGDGVITIFDVVICTSHYGQKYP